MRNNFRSIFENSSSASHIDFWLGEKLGLPQLASNFHHIKGKFGQESDNTPPLFNDILKITSNALKDNLFHTSDLGDLTTKDIYRCFLEDLPDAPIEIKYPDRDWNLVWSRLESGVLNSKSRSILYLIIHERVNTKERGHRLMPGRYPSPQCPRCRVSDSQSPSETSSHRYLHCNLVSDSWAWIRSTIQTLDNSNLCLNDDEILSLNFFVGLRENTIVWLLGVFVELVESQVVLREQHLNVDTLIGNLKQRKLMSK